MTDISKMSSAEIAELLQNRKKEEREALSSRRQAYESLRNEIVDKIASKVYESIAAVQELYKFTVDETAAFKSIMAEYGQLKRDDQMSFTLKNENFSVEIKSNKVKKFDERADVAARRLIEFLMDWIQGREKGTRDPMYKLGMTLLERNKYGDLDYKSISQLYDMEADFDSPEYSEIMQLFRESHLIEGTAVNYYFMERDKERNIWRKLEPSFNRL